MFIKWNIIWQLKWNYIITDKQQNNSMSLQVYFGEGNGTPLQYSCLENPMDRGAWWAAVHGAVKNRT